MRNFDFRLAVIGALLAALSCAPAGAQTIENVTVLGTAQNEPLAMTGFTTEALRQAGVTSLADLGQAVPGLRVDSYGPAILPALRGVGVQSIEGPGVESDVAVYVDGFRQNSLDSLLFDFGDVARVDVLKGPQGTQFGQNATAGAILITIADPVFTTGGSASLGYGAFNDFRAQGTANIALTDSLALSLSATHRDSDNYFTEIISGRPSAPIHSTALRGKLLFQPDADARLLLTAQYSDVEDPTSLAYLVENPSAALYHDAFGVPMAHTTQPWTTSLNRTLRNNPRTWSTSLAGTFDLGWATLTTRTQFRGMHTDAASDLDGTTISYWDLDLRESDQTLTQEIDLGGTQDGAFRWHGGLLYSNDLGGLTYHLFQDPFGTGVQTPLLYSQIHVATDSTGLFGDFDYDLAPDWTLSAGARLTHEDKSMRSALLMAPFIPGAGRGGWTDLSPRLALSHALDPDSRVYAAVTQGFKGGNFNYIGAGPQAPVKAEHVTQYEVGYKQATAAWSLDAAAYFSHWRNLQTFTYQSSCGCFQFANAPLTEVYGAEASAQVKLDENFSATAALAYTHARYRSFTGEAPTGGPYLPPAYGYATGPVNFAGDSTVRSPDWTGNVGLAWHMPTTIGAFNAAANLYLTSTVPFTPDKQLAQGGYGLLNLSLGWASAEGAWSASMSGQNVTGRRYQNFAAEGLLGHSIIHGAPASWFFRIEHRL